MHFSTRCVWVCVRSIPHLSASVWLALHERRVKTRCDVDVSSHDEGAILDIFVRGTAQSVVVRRCSFSRWPAVALRARLYWITIKRVHARTSGVLVFIGRIFIGVAGRTPCYSGSHGILTGISILFICVYVPLCFRFFRVSGASRGHSGMHLLEFCLFVRASSLVVQVGGVLNAIEAKANIFDWSGDDTSQRPQVRCVVELCAGGLRNPRFHFQIHNLSLRNNYYMMASIGVKVIMLAVSVRRVWCCAGVGVVVGGGGADPCEQVFLNSSYSLHVAIINIACGLFILTVSLQAKPFWCGGACLPPA